MSEKIKLSDFRSAAADGTLTWEFVVSKTQGSKIEIQVNHEGKYPFEIKDLIHDWQKLCSAIEQQRESVIERMTELESDIQRLKNEKLYVVDALFHAGDIKLGDDVPERYGRAVRTIVKQRDELKKAYEYFKERGDLLEQEVKQHSDLLSNMAQAYNGVRKACLTLSHNLAEFLKEQGTETTQQKILEAVGMVNLLKKEDPKNETKKD